MSSIRKVTKQRAHVLINIHELRSVVWCSYVAVHDGFDSERVCCRERVSRARGECDINGCFSHYCI